MKKSFILYFLIALLSIGIVYGNGSHNLEEAKQILEAKIPCSQLTEEQLEHIGDYYMEQMHPGEAHEAMDEMMGGEGSESLRQMHIAMAKRLYCNDISGMVNYGMMGMMGSGGMMNMIGGGNMMGYFNPFGHGWFNIYGFIFMLLFWGLIIWLIAWIITRYTKPQIEKKESAMEILKKRYAKGEINKKQFDKMKKELK